MFLLRNVLLVSKQFFHLVAPILYESPFELINSTIEEPHQLTLRLARLLGTLLGSVAHKRFVMDALPPLGQSFTRFRLSNRDILSLTSSTLFNNNDNNISNSNNIIINNSNTCDLDPDVQYAVDALDSMGAIPLTIDYLRFYIYHRHLTISDAFPTLFPSLDCHSVDEWLNSKHRQPIMDVFDRAFVMHCPEAVVSCCIPIPRIGPYLEAVSRLRRLKKVRFYDLRGKLAVQNAIRFVQQHDTLSLGPLLSSSFSSSSDSMAKTTSLSTTLSTSKPDSHYASLTAIDLGGGRGTRDFICNDESLGDLLGAMRQLHEVDTDCLIFRVNFLEKIPPVSGLRVLRLGPMADVVDLTAPELAQTLQRFTTLEELQIYLEDSRRHMFYYLIQEKKKQNEVEAIQYKGASHANQGLKRLSIGGNLRTTVRATQEALTAYSETIRSLKVNCHEHFEYNLLDEASLLADDPDLEPGSLPLPPLETNTPWAPMEPRHMQEQKDFKTYQSVNLCWATMLPCLVRLEIVGLASILGFHAMALRTCPNLEVLRLHVTFEHRMVIARCHVETMLDSLLYARGQKSQGQGFQEGVRGQGARLQELDLNGRWFISDRAFALLGSPCFPQMRSLSLHRLETVDEDQYNFIRKICRSDNDIKALELSKFMRQIPRCDAARLNGTQIEGRTLAREHGPASGDITGTCAELTVNGLLAGLCGMERLTEKSVELDTDFIVESHLHRLKVDTAYKKEYDRLVEWVLSMNGGWLFKKAIAKRYNHTTVWEVIDQACRLDSYDIPPWSR
ncbi:hypothetical protein BGZ93_002948 [Podila epicladia]|nr:hypothetical protein BGZ92_007332 [Podila epicladia]KAG0097348.1 hypothetical protein BGZ93_002948 [Podila epicladia]